MELLELPGWRIEYDRDATIAAHACAPPTNAESCGCEPCQNWAATRNRLLPEDFCQLLDRLGIPRNRECEVYHNCRLASGLHSYGGWYHFVGYVLFGELECSPNVNYESFSVYFHSKPVLVPEAFAGLTTTQLEFTAEVPWLSVVPESE